jgi:hypothetical protein
MNLKFLSIFCNERKEVECSICFEPLKNETKRHFKCNHLYHEDCIKKWFGTCPCCRSEVVNSEDSKILLKYSIQYGDTVLIKSKYSPYILKGKFTHIISYPNKKFLHLIDLEILNNYKNNKLILNYFNVLVTGIGSNIEFIKTV